MRNQLGMNLLGILALPCDRFQASFFLSQYFFYEWSSNISHIDLKTCGDE